MNLQNDHFPFRQSNRFINPRGNHLVIRHLSHPYSRQSNHQFNLQSNLVSVPPPRHPYIHRSSQFSILPYNHRRNRQYDPYHFRLDALRFSRLEDRPSGHLNSRPSIPQSIHPIFLLCNHILARPYAQLLNRCNRRQTNLPIYPVLSLINHHLLFLLINP